jgi:hypothetical protein
MPITFLRKMNKPRVEKFLIGFLMALGLMASAAVIIKSVYGALNLDAGTDILPKSLYISLWAKLEELLGIIAACAPALKSPAERLLRHLGLLGDKVLDIVPNLGYRYFQDGRRSLPRRFGRSRKRRTVTRESQPPGQELPNQPGSSETALSPKVYISSKQNVEEEENTSAHSGWKAV